MVYRRLDDREYYEAERFLLREFRRLLEREERSADLRPRQARMDYAIATDRLRLYIDFEGDRRSGWEFSREIERIVYRMDEGTILSIYWRAYEEFLVERDLRGARERLDEVVRRTTDYVEIAYAQQRYRAEAEIIRRRHAPTIGTQLRIRLPHDYQVQTWDSPFGSSEAQKRGEELLEANLTKAQWRSYKSEGFFYVRGRQTKRMYRIRTGTSINIDELKKDGSVKRRWCFAPEGYLCAADVMLAQKIAFENFEKEALKVANKFGPNGPSIWQF